MQTSRNASAVTVVEEREIDSVADKSKSLEILDNAPPAYSEKFEATSSLFTIFCSGFALISDGIQNNIFSLTNVVFAQLFGATIYTSARATALGNSLTIGTIVGQLTIGVVCDRFGRKVGIVVATGLVVLGIILATASHGTDLNGLLWMLTVARGITGFGVGAEYCCSSASAVEAANARSVKSRGPTFILVTNLVLSLGGPVASILYLIVFEAAGGLNVNLNTLWRTVFGITVIFPLIVFIFRMRMIDSKLYRKSAIKKNVPYLLIGRYYWRSLVGTAGAWFLYDVVVFPNGLFSGAIIASIVKTEGTALIRQTASYQLLLGVLSLPGLFLGILALPYLGRRNTMLVGFGGFLVVGSAVAGSYDTVSQNITLFIVLYGLLVSSGNFGPGNMLGLVSSESYATAVRGTCYGLSAAIGKAGAVVGNSSFLPIRDNFGPRWTFVASAIVGVFGMLVTFFFVRNDLDGDLSDEDAKFEKFLRANGYEGEFGTEVVREAGNEEKGESLSRSESEEEEKSSKVSI